MGMILSLGQQAELTERKESQALEVRRRCRLFLGRSEGRKMRGAFG